MLAILLGAVGAFALSLSAAELVQPFTAGFRIKEIETSGSTLHVRVGGQGPAVVLLHGYGETGDMWAPLSGRTCRRPYRRSGRD